MHIGLSCSVDLSMKNITSRSGLQVQLITDKNIDKTAYSNKYIIQILQEMVIHARILHILFQTVTIFCENPPIVVLLHDFIKYVKY